MPCNKKYNHYKHKKKLNNVFITSLIVIGLILIGFRLLLDTVEATDTRREYYNKDGDTTLSIYGTIWNGQTFTIGATGDNIAFNLTSVKLYISKLGNPGTCYCYIYSVSSITGLPMDATISGVGFNGNLLSTSLSWVEINFSQYYYFNPNKVYAVVLCAPSGSLINCLNWRMDASSPAYTGGTRIYSINSGSTWITNSSHDFLFEIYGKNVFNSTITVYNNTKNTTGGYDIIYNENTGVSAWLNFTGYSNDTSITVYNNTVNTTGTYETVYNSATGFYIWINYTGFSSELQIIEYLLNCTGTHDSIYNNLTGWIVYNNYTGNISYDNTTNKTICINLSGHGFFLNWTGDYNGTLENISITLDTNKNITGNFEDNDTFYEDKYFLSGTLIFENVQFIIILLVSIWIFMLYEIGKNQPFYAKLQFFVAIPLMCFFFTNAYLISNDFGGLAFNVAIAMVIILLSSAILINSSFRKKG